MSDRIGITATVVGYLFALDRTTTSGGKAIAKANLRLPSKTRDGLSQTGWWRVMVPSTVTTDARKGDKVGVTAFGSWSEWTDKEGKRHSEWSWVATDFTVLERDERAPRENDDIPF